MVDRPRRLRREYDVRVTRAKGRSAADGPLVARVRLGVRPGEPNRYAVVAGKKVGGAVARNRLKRLVREAVRTLDPDFSQGNDIVLILRGKVDELPSSSAARQILCRIARRIGLLSGRPAGAAPDPAASESGAAAASLVNSHV